MRGFGQECEALEGFFPNVSMHFRDPVEMIGGGFLTPVSRPGKGRESVRGEAAGGRGF